MVVLKGEWKMSPMGKIGACTLGVGGGSGIRNLSTSNDILLIGLLPSGMDVGLPGGAR